MTLVELAFARLRPAVGFERRRGSRRRDARTALLGGLLFVLAAHVALAAMVETKKTHWRDPEFFHRLHRLVELSRYRKAQGHTGPLVVVVGGSRPQMGLSPVHLGRGLGSEQVLRPTDPLVFDLVQAGMMTIGERLALARLFATDVKPDYLLLELRAPALVDPPPVENYIPPVRLGWRDVESLKPYHTRPDRVRFEWLRERATSWYSLRRPLLDNWGWSRQLPPGPQRTDFAWKEMTMCGWSPHYPAVWPDDLRATATEVARGQYQDHLRRFRIDPINDRLFRDMLAECRSRGVKVALFVMPESPLFRSWYPPGARGQFAEYASTLSRECGAPVFNGLDWIDDESAYMDGHHLLGPAAERFSERLGRECVAPWLAGTP